MDTIENDNIRFMYADMDDEKSIRRLRADAFSFNMRQYPYEKLHVFYIYEIEEGIFVCCNSMYYNDIRKLFDYLIHGKKRIPVSNLV